ncbi:MAG TPA: DnaB-like helicase C-terminal domain-containing protein, partial [Acidimicrobiia bacterium]
RAKCRRLKAMHGDLGLVVVDYLQLMSTPRRSENRQVEVSELSRGLKILARDLETPVMALSQLNRSLEYRTDKRPMLADLRESGCLTGETRLLRADDNSEVTLADLVRTGARDVPVWSLDDRWRLVPATLTHAFPSGTKPIYRLHLASGRQLRATANHRFRTVTGWEPLGELALGDELAAPAKPTAPDLGGVMWDRIVAIERLGEEEVFDATVVGTHNFVANGVVAHNSIEQDADVVAFIYRDDAYNPDSSEKGTAEIIVAKHRNGPTAKVRLAFLEHLTKFANMARR